MYPNRREVLRRLASLLPPTALSFVTSGCSSNDSRSKPPSIVVLGEDSSNLNAIEALSPGFTAASGTHVAFDKSTFELSGQKATQDLMRGTGLYDILMQYNFQLASFVGNDWVITVDQLAEIVPGFDKLRSFESDLFPNAWREVGFYRKRGAEKDVVVGYPFASNTMLLVYNRSLFGNPARRADFQRRYHRELSVPTSWPEFRQVAEFFTLILKRGTQGVSFWEESATGGWLYYEWATIAVVSMGGGVPGKKTRGWGG